MAILGPTGRCRAFCRPPHLQTDTTLRGVGLYHRYLPVSYDPAVQGAITAITYEEDVFQSSTPIAEEAYTNSYLLIYQAGQIYRTWLPIPLQGQLFWQLRRQTGLTATDFYPVEGGSDRPDFSASGQPLSFGFLRAHARNIATPIIPGSQDVIIDHAIDDWSVTIYSEPPETNRPPVAQDDLFIMSVDDEHMSLNVLANDDDPNGDILFISDIPTHPESGYLFVNPLHVEYFYQGGSVRDAFEYTVTENKPEITGILTDTATVTILIDCGCAFKCLLYVKPTARSNDLDGLSPVSGQVDNLDIDLMYRIRDEVMKPTPHGARYVDMYYHITPEILKILILDRPDLGAKAVAVVEGWQDHLRNLLDGDGSAVISQAQIDTVEGFLSDLSAAGSPKLRQSIADELARLGPLDEYVGLPVKAAKRRAIGDPTIYLPLILKD